MVLIGVGCHDDGNYLAQEVVALLDICSIAGQPLKAPLQKQKTEVFPRAHSFVANCAKSSRQSTDREEPSNPFATFPRKQHVIPKCCNSENIRVNFFLGLLWAVGHEVRLGPKLASRRD